MPRRSSESDDLRPVSFDEEESADLRRQYLRQAIRLALVFVVLFAAVMLAFRWSGAAVSFGASRAADRAIPTWHVKGRITDAATGRPVSWAKVEDDFSGRPPFYRTEADHSGTFDLMTLAEPHSVRITAPGYAAETIRIGRVWFLWIPRGDESHDILLTRN